MVNKKLYKVEFYYSVPHCSFLTAQINFVASDLEGATKLARKYIERRGENGIWKYPSIHSIKYETSVWVEGKDDSSS